MSDETPDSETGKASGSMQRMLMIGLAAAAVIVLFVTTVSIILIFALRSDVAALEDQARRAANDESALQEEIAGIKNTLRAAGQKSSVGAEVRPGNIDAADPAHDCLIRPGKVGSVADCIELGTKASH